MWVWRKSINWTTIALDTDETTHKLTATPYEAVALTRHHLQACPDVSTITFFDWNGQVLTDEVVEYLQFDPLPGSSMPAMSANMPAMQMSSTSLATAPPAVPPSMFNAQFAGSPLPFNYAAHPNAFPGSNPLSQAPDQTAAATVRAPRTITPNCPQHRNLPTSEAPTAMTCHTCLMRPLSHRV